MDIVIQSLGFKASEHLEKFVHERLDKFVKEAEIVRAHVTLFLGPEGNPDKYYCEIRLEVPGNDHFAKRNSESFEKSIAETAEILHQVIRKTKGKLLKQSHLANKHRS